MMIITSKKNGMAMKNTTMKMMMDMTMNIDFINR